MAPGPRHPFEQDERALKLREQRDGLYGISNILDLAGTPRRQCVCGWPAHAGALECHHECGESPARADRHQDVLEFFLRSRTEHPLTKCEASEARLPFREESLEHVFGEPRGIDEPVIGDVFQLTCPGAGTSMPASARSQKRR